MRRKDRAVLEFEDIISIMKKCDVCRIAMIDNDISYIVPMNFGYDCKDENIWLYFHSAKIGRKIDILKKNPIVCFEMDCQHKLVSAVEACGYSFLYESIIGIGKVEFLENSHEKIYGLEQLMKKMANQNDCKFSEREVDNLSVFRCKIKEITAKRHI